MSSPGTSTESLWPRVAALPLMVEACEYDRLHAVLAHDFQRVTTHVRLVGAGTDGLGEDVSIHVEDGTSLHGTRPALPLAGEWTVESSCEHLEALELWVQPPEWELARRMRNEVSDEDALLTLYDHVLAAFPAAYLEDPHERDGIAQRLADHVDRVSYDAPIQDPEDIGATPLPGRVVNVRPSRIGSVRGLLDIYARCAHEQRPMYGGGMGELGVGRGQIELLAALFHPDAPNDVAPSAYNEDDPDVPLPASPLAPRPEAAGFRWAGPSAAR
jgi:hypothetical protein